MAGINMMGSYSGIDKNTIDQLMAAEKLPLVQLSNKKSSIAEQQSAWKDINTRLNSLFEKVKALQNKDIFNTKSSTSTNEKIISMTTGKNAVAGIYKINVKQLATNTRIIGGEIKDFPTNETTGEKDITEPMKIKGSFIIKNHNFGDTLLTEEDKAALTVKIEEGDSLKDIANKINHKNMDTGISASIINNQLVLTDSKTGSRSLQLENISHEGETIDVLEKLSLATEAPTETTGDQSIFNINGIEVTSNSNTVTNVLEGTTINLTKAHNNEDEYDTVTIAQDNFVIEKAVKEFVEQYNSTMTFIEDKLKAGDPKTPGSKGALSGDNSLMRLHSSLRNLVTSATPNSNTDIKDMSQLGVTTIDRFGMLKFDASKLTKALSENPEDVMNFFNSTVDGKEAGFATRLGDYIDSFISGDKGIIKTKTEGLEKTLKDLTKQIENFDARMVKKEAYYIKKFTALDVAMMQAESQMSWLQGQVDSMNGIKR